MRIRDYGLVITEKGVSMPVVIAIVHVAAMCLEIAIATVIVIERAIMMAIVVVVAMLVVMVMAMKAT